MEELRGGQQRALFAPEEQGAHGAGKAGSGLNFRRLTPLVFFGLLLALLIEPAWSATAQGCADTSPPVILCPTNLVAYAPIGQCAATVSFLVAATNRCDPSPVVTCVPASGAIFPVGSTSVACTARDASGNVSTSNFNVTVYPPLVAPPIQWQQAFGGSADDFLTESIQTTDGGYLLGGTSYSTTGANKTARAYGSGDFWQVRLDPGGKLLWDRSFGGTGDDALNCLLQTSDGGFLLGGSSASSTNGSKSAPNYGGYDYWVIRLSPAGDELWERSFGGTNDDLLYAVTQTTDGGFLLGGASSSMPGGNKTSVKYGRSDFWLVRLDSNGNKLWEQSFGGAGDDVLTALKPTSDGGFFAGGYSASAPSGNKTSPNYGAYDFWVLRLDSAGSAIWQRSFGGSGSDQLYALQTTPDGGCLLAGGSSSAPSGNKTSPNFGSSDFWLVRLDADGQKLWENSYGGSGYDEAHALLPASDGGFLAGGFSGSDSSGNKTSPNFGGYDYWIVRLDANGTRLWDQSFGGSGWDNLYSLCQTEDGGWLLGGSSPSPVGGNKTAPAIGQNDFWVLKLAGSAPSILCPTGLVAECTSSSGAIVSFDATAATTCQPVLPVTCIPSSGSLFPLGTTLVSCLATDAFGLTAQHTFPVTVRDSVPPTLSSPSDVTVDADPGFCFASNVPLGMAVATDLGGSVTISNNAPPQFPTGLTPVIWTAIDPSGNTSAATQTVTVIEHEPPRLICPSNVVAFAPAGQYEARVTFTVSATDNCDPAPTIICEPPPDALFPAGRTTVRCSARDRSGNTTTNSFFVSVYPAPSVPPIEWQRSLGGSGNDWLTSLQATGDGGLILGGYSASPPGGSKTSANYGNYDYWLVRLNAQGDELWEQSYGGNSYDALSAVAQTSDGGFILGGTSASPPSGTKSSPNYGAYDFWVVRTDANGKELWEKSFGGSATDWLYSLRQTRDGGFILGGWSASPPSGSKTSPSYGNNDFWVLRLDAAGNVIWDRSFGGTGADTLYDLRETRDGGFILGGSSASGQDGNKTSPNFGSEDFWLIRLDDTGNKLWERTYGGTGSDVLFSLQEAADGGFFLAGYSSSPPSGTKTSPNFGDTDYWIVRTDANGRQLWDQSLGGSGTDGFPPNPKIQITSDGGVVIGGQSDSPPSGNKLSPGFGSSDFWIARLDANGAKLWDQSFGGTNYECLLALEQTPQGGLLLGGASFSGPNGNKTTPSFGQADFWVIKLAGSAPITPTFSLDSIAMDASQTNPILQFRLHGQPGFTYTLQRTTALSLSNSLWTDSAIGTAGTETSDPGLILLYDTNPPSPCFYRVQRK